MPEMSKEEMGSKFAEEVAKVYMPKVLDEIKIELKAEINKFIGQKLEGMEVTQDINTEFTISGSDVSGKIQVDLGEIKGEHEERVRGYRRKGRTVKGHRRTLKDKATFKEGEDYITSGTVPNDVIYKQVVKPYLEKKFSTILADDIPA